MEFYKLFLLFLMMILASGQDTAGPSSLTAGVVTTTKTIVGSFGSELFSMIQTITSTSVPTTAAFDELQSVRSTVYSASILYVSYTNVVTTTLFPQNTSTAVITINITSTASHTSTITSTELSTVTAVTTAFTPLSSIATGLCYVAAQDVLTPCTAGVLASATAPIPTVSSALASSPAIRNTPNKVFKFLASLKRHVVGANHNEKRASSCGSWQAAIIITALFIAFSLVSILFFATLLREKKEELPRLYAHRWWIYGSQGLLAGLLIWLIVWSAMKTVGNGCN
ncbi:hypothetical protein EAF04_002025 [Stromatinia cepivora]|nr:hypothetical protein EAF04_002025 [Stromatinia cepivora]